MKPAKSSIVVPAAKVWNVVMSVGAAPLTDCCRWKLITGCLLASRPTLLTM
jgi:hypothetical protein